MEVKGVPTGQSLSNDTVCLVTDRACFDWFGVFCGHEGNVALVAYNYYVQGFVITEAWVGRINTVLDDISIREAVRLVQPVLELRLNARRVDRTWDPKIHTPIEMVSIYKHSGLFHHSIIDIR